MLTSIRLITAVSLTAALFGPAPAAGQPQPTPAPGAAAAAAPAPNPAVARIQSLNQEAITAFGNYNFKKARKRLRKAMREVKRAGLSSSPEAANVNVLMGVAYISGSNDLYRGLHYFVRGLRINRKTAVPLNLMTPQLKNMLKVARKTIKVVKTPPTIALEDKKKQQGGSSAAAKAGGRGLIHEPIDMAKRGLVIPIKASAGLDIKAHRVFLFFHRDGTARFKKKLMRKRHGFFRAAIPRNATTGRKVYYYIEAMDQRGRLAGSKGSARSPNVIDIK